MNLDLNEDQRVIKDAVGSLAARHAQFPTAAPYVLDGGALEAELVEAGFLQADNGLGALDAVLVIEELGRTPYAIEVGSLLLSATALRGRLPRPLALVRPPRMSAIRNLVPGGSALIVTDDEVRLARPSEAEIEQLTTPFAYPYGALKTLDLSDSDVLRDVNPAEVLQWWRVALAAEVGAAGRAAVESTAQYVKDRHQFGRAIGSFQAVQHRLAACVTSVHGVEIISRRAAASRDPADAAMACAFAQHAARQLHYECIQFHGAMGLTLECPLHHWTYRLKALQGELGGLSAQATVVADLLWPRRDHSVEA